MKIITAEDIKDKKVLLRLDLDVPVENAVVTEDFRLKAGIPTLKLCIENASKVIIIGHMGRPEGIDPAFSLKPVCEWLNARLEGAVEIEFEESLEQIQNSSAKVIMLENIRFFPGESEGDLDFAKKLATFGDFFINEAFASHNPAASTTVLPTLFPHVKDPEGRLRPRRAAGLRFAQEIKVLTDVRDNPKKPFVAVMGGAKVEDKLPAIEALAKKADAVLVGGKLVSEIRQLSGFSSQLSEKSLPVVSLSETERQTTDRPNSENRKQKTDNRRLPGNVFVGKLTEDGLDMAAETIESWRPLLMRATLIVWNGPVGKFEDPKNDATKKIAEIILRSTGDIVIGGGDTIAALNQAGLLKQAEEKAFVSTGGGAMLKFLTNGSLPTIEALGI